MSAHAESRSWVWGTWPQAVQVALGIAVWAVFYSTGGTYNLMVLALWAGPIVLVGSRIWRQRRGDLARPLWRDRSAAHVVQFVNFALLWVLIAVAMAPAPVNIQFTPAGHILVVLSLCVGAAVLATSGVVPKRRASVTINLVAIVGSIWFAMQLGRVHLTPSGVVALQVPVEGHWYVFQGGRSVLYNQHFPVPAQRHALDLVTVEGGFGDQVRSPASGTVSWVIDGHADQPPGSMDTVNPAGNYVTIDMGDGRFVLLAHLRMGSVAVEVGDVLEPGDLVGEVGNSGNTSQPHLHLQVQNAPTFEGASRTWPVAFDEVLRGGADELAREVPRRDDRLSGEGS